MISKHGNIMDQQASRGRSPSAGHHQPHISQSHSPSPSPFPTNASSIGLGLAVDQSAQQPFDVADNSFGSFDGGAFINSQQSQSQHHGSVSEPNIFDPNNSFGQPAPPTGSDTTLSFNAQSQPAYLSPNLNDGGDFSLFESSGASGDQFNAPLFDQPTLNPSDINNMTSPQTHQSPTPPHLLQPDGHQAGSAHQSPAFNQHQFSSPPSHSRHASLGPEAALLQGQIGDWTQPQFQGHRRSASEYSDVSSVAPSPNLISADSFDVDPIGHSPLQRPSDPSLYDGVLQIGAFSLSDPQMGSPGHHARSPSHSPAISPRIIPQQMPDMQPQYVLAPPNNTYGGSPGYPNIQGSVEAFPTLQSTSGPDMSQMAAPPAINIDYAPNMNNQKLGPFDAAKQQMDQDSLTPPDRGTFEALELS